MIMFFFGLVFAFTPPIPEVVRSDSEGDVWLVQDSRSSWSVAHLCLQSSEDRAPLVTVESLLSLRIQEEADLFLSRGVEVHQRVSANEICLQVGSLQTELGWGLRQAERLLRELQWSRVDWKEVQRLYQEELEVESGRLASLHRLAEHVVWFDERWMDWSWYYWTINYHLRQFRKRAKMKLVIIGDWTTEEVIGLIPERPERRKNRRRTKRTDVEMFSKPECALIDVPGFPQVAVSHRFSFPDLSATERQYLSIVLGHGTRSRLMEELREERGLLYSLGTQVQGEDIVVRYSLPPESLNEVMTVVFEIVRGLSTQPMTELEFSRAQGVLSQRYYRILEDYHRLAANYTLYSRPDSWATIVSARLSHRYEEQGSLAMFSTHSSIITGFSRNSRERLAQCETIVDVEFSDLVELK